MPIGRVGSKLFNTLLDIRRNDLETWRSILEVYLDPADKDTYRVFLQGFNTTNFQVSHIVGKSVDGIDYALLKVSLPGIIYPFSIFLYANARNSLSIYCPFSGNIRWGCKPFEIPKDSEGLVYASKYLYDTYLGINPDIKELIPVGNIKDYLMIAHLDYIELPESPLTEFRKIKIEENKTLMIEEFNKNMILYEETLF